MPPTDSPTDPVPAEPAGVEVDATIGVEEPAGVGRMEQATTGVRGDEHVPTGVRVCVPIGKATGALRRFVRFTATPKRYQLVRFKYSDTNLSDSRIL